MTRRLTAHLFCSVNGVAESPNLWQFDAFGPEECQMMGRAISGGTDVVIGRKLWQEWSQYWPDADASDPFGQFINPVRKHVVSRTLSGAVGWNSAVIDSDPAAYVARLKQEGSGDILLVGGIETHPQPVPRRCRRRAYPHGPPRGHPGGTAVVRRVRAGDTAAAHRQRDHQRGQRRPDLRTTGLTATVSGPQSLSQTT